MENVPGTSHMCLKCSEGKHGREMVPVLSMFLTCSHPFPGVLAPSVKTTTRIFLGWRTTVSLVRLFL